MLSFGIRFILCNIFIAVFIVLLLTVKRIFRKHLSGQMQYHLWFLLLALLAVPFLPISPTRFLQLSFRADNANGSSHPMETAGQTPPVTGSASTADWIKDFSISMSREFPSFLGPLLFSLWLIGICVMVVLTVRAGLKLHRLEKSALPLQNKEVQKLYDACIHEMHLCRKIPIYSTAFLKSPITVGFFRPRIYLPIPLISDFSEKDMRYMLLHELQHYKHKDALTNFLMNLAGILYWFHPLVRYAFREMRNDREIARDSDVLQMLNEKDYVDYGHTLLNFAEKISRPSFPFASQIGGNMKQMKRRILSIAFYKPETKWTRAKGWCLFLILAVLALEAVSFLPSHAAEDAIYTSHRDREVLSEDLSSFFRGYEGCFVLYDDSADTWQIYNESMARQRVSPDSTYKIYSALFALEQGYITPASSTIQWNGQDYPIPEWNQNQTLTSALQNSVNWYFQALDGRAGFDALEHFYTGIEYGNHNLSGGVSNFWAESSLKISALEQVELLKKMYDNDFDFQTQNIQTVKDAMFLSSSGKDLLYGKTGTGNVNGKYVNGWFIGYVVSENDVYFFATNIQNDSTAHGSAACEITLRILKDKDIYK